MNYRIILKCRRNAAFLLLSLILVSVLAGCRTTVENYRNAYQTAIEKRNNDAVDDDLLPPGAALLDIDGPSVQIFEGDTIYYETKHLSFPDSIMVLPYNVIAGIYTIDTNARGHLSQLLPEYPETTVAKSADSGIYVVSGAFPDKESAMRHAIKRKKKKGVIYPGMKHTPLIVELPSPRG